MICYVPAFKEMEVRIVNWDYPKLSVLSLLIGLTSAGDTVTETLWNRAEWCKDAKLGPGVHPSRAAVSICYRIEYKDVAGNREPGKLRSVG